MQAILAAVGQHKPNPVQAQPSRMTCTISSTGDEQAGGHLGVRGFPPSTRGMPQLLELHQLLGWLTPEKPINSCLAQERGYGMLCRCQSHPLPSPVFPILPRNALSTLPCHPLTTLFHPLCTLTGRGTGFGAGRPAHIFVLVLLALELVLTHGPGTFYPSSWPSESYMGFLGSMPVIKLKQIWVDL